VANAAEAIVELELDDSRTMDELIWLLERKDPQEPVSAWKRPNSDGEADKSKPEVFTVRELVKINHHRNCMLCHRPANNEFLGSLEQGVATVPNPRRALAETRGVGYGGPSPDDAIRFDITYVRPDFSLIFPVDKQAHGGIWPEQQRFDFV